MYSKMVQNLWRYASEEIGKEQFETMRRELM